MSDTIIDFEQVKINNLKLKKCTHISDNYFILPIKYRERDVDKNFIIQTPLLYSSEGLIEYINSRGKKKFFIDFSLHDQNINNDIKAFKKFILKIEKYTLKKSQIFGKKLKKNINENYLNSCLKTTNENKELIRVKINTNNNDVDIGIYNENKELIDLSYINKEIRAVSIIEIPELWYFNGNFGYTINILQIRIDIKKKLSNYAFIDDINSNNEKNNFIPIKDDERFKKYFKMLKMRIPINSIKEKMSLENIDPSIIDLDPDKPYIDNNTNSNTNNQSLINNNILLLGLNSLKKTEIDKKEEFKKKLKPLSNGFEPPSTDMLLSIRNNLKPTQK